MTVARKRRRSLSEVKNEGVVGEFPENKRRKIDHVQRTSVKRCGNWANLLLHGPKTFVFVSRLTMGENRGTFFLHHSELQTMKRNCWISFQVMEFFLNLLISESKSRSRLLYISGKLMTDLFNGARSQLLRESRLMLDVDMDRYDGAVSFIHVSANHWMLVYINALSAQLSLFDPLYPSHEKEESEEMARKFTNFLTIRDYFLPTAAISATKWSCIKWQGQKMDHDLQRDTTSCGVFVLKFADQLIRGFPALPEKKLKVSSESEQVWKIREKMVGRMEMGGDDKKSYCSMCGSNSEVGTIGCVICGRRFHQSCLFSQDPTIFTSRSDLHQWIGPICRNLMLVTPPSQPCCCCE